MKPPSRNEEILDEDRILEVLRQVKGPQKTGNIVDLGLVKDLSVSGGRVVFSIEVPEDLAPKLEGMRAGAEKIVSVLPGADKVLVALTAQRVAGAKPAAPTAMPSPTGATPAKRLQSAKPAGQDIAGVRHIVAVASGKGGVGKSTTTVNLALALASNGLKVGVLDADIYGPSIPTLLGESGKPEATANKQMRPKTAHGIKFISMGLMVDADAALIWRGPMVASALNQMLRDVQWGELDVLILDLPPGTGDVQLTLAQKVPLSGAIVVSTPQDLALIDARRAISMFDKTGIPMLGLIENMSHFVCNTCGERHEIFGNGGTRSEADKLAVPFLGEVPLSLALRQASDAGTPQVISEPDSAPAKAYRSIAEQLLPSLKLSRAQLARPAPRIIIES
ncbi:Mrp/NBP35 family ATP-binding protein [Pseudovibrio hongkongensis]|uniref:Mrp/NBP35 family ATP-binding protein n=1 Tax=Polycladidibacter hongkongensis TaxID=1647556 RepID=UPI00083695A8